MSVLSSRIRPWIAPLATALAIGGVAAARAAENPGLAGKSVSPRLAEIVVTARGWREDLQRVPDSVSVFTQSVIEERGIRTIQDAVSYVPSVSFVNSQDAGLSNISVRGIGQVRNGEPPVAVVVDGVELSSPDEIKQVLDDVTRIEVLKGPQGALYGRNAIGGAIVIDTAKPSDHLTARVKAGTGNGAYRQGSAMLSGPLVQQLAAFRLTAGYSDFGGLIENVTLHRKVDFDTSRFARARLMLGKSLSDGGPWSLDIIGSWSNFGGGASYYIPLPDGEPNNTSIPVQSGQLGRSSRLLKNISARLDVALNGMDLRSITAGSRVDVSLLESIDWNPDTFLGATQERRAGSWSEDLRLISPTDRRVRWVAGLYYLDVDRTTDTVLLLGPAPYTPVPVVGSNELSKASAAFAQADIDLTRHFSLTLAGRYDRDRRTLEDHLAGGPDRPHTFDAWQPKISLSYRVPSTLAHDAMIYATAARGFRSGGFNAPDSAFPPIYQSELVTSYEVGEKSAWLQGRLQANGALFLEHDDNRQVFILAPGAQQGIINARRTRIDGAELELRAEPTRGLEIDLALSRLDSRILDFNGTRLYVGNKVPLAYGWSSNFSTQYAFQAGPATMTLWAGYERRADNFWHIDNADRQAPVDLLSARLAADFGSWSMTLWAKNLLDKAYTEEFFAKEFAGTANDIRYPGEPRTYGLTLEYRF